MENSKKNNTINKNKKKENNHTVFLIFSIFILLLALVSTVFADCMKIYENKKMTKEYSEKRELLLEEEASLNSEIDKLQDPDYVARYARERYGYTKDGEKILTIIDGQVIAAAENNWQIWKYLFFYM